MSPSVQRRTSITDWHKQQYFSHWQLLSDCSHCAQRYLAVPVPVLMTILYRSPTADGIWHR